MRLLVEKIKLIVFDFDGVFTDNGVYVFEDGREAVRCSRYDGMGVTLLRRRDFPMMILSTETNPVVSARAKKLKIDCEQGCSDKGIKLQEIAKERGLSLDQIAYVGNDVNDKACLEIVGLPIVVADAHPSVASLGRYTTRADGGKGAVREVCDLFLQEKFGEDQAW